MFPLFSILYVLAVFEGVAAHPQVVQTPPNAFKWGSIGDSWASGVRYTPGNAYDDDPVCRRINHAYSVQMSKDNSWTDNGQEFDFKACSGARLGNMAKDDPQIDKLDSPQLVTMTAGGNNANFFFIAVNCIYQPDIFHDYGPDYDEDHDRTGDCAKSIDETHAYIANPEDEANKALGTDLRLTIDDILKSPTTQKNDQFFLYITGYVHFFNVDEDWCNTVSFGAIPDPIGKQPKLTKKLRKDMNGLVELFNTVYRRTIENYKPRHGALVGFVDVSPGYGGHRFCEQGHNTKDQYYGDNVWIWNLSLDALGNQTTQDSGGIPDCDKGCDLLDFSVPGPDKDDITTSSDASRTRVLHPKEQGHTVMKDAIIAKLRADKVPGVKQAVVESGLLGIFSGVGVTLPES